MTAHSIAPGYMKILYSGTQLPHTQTLPIRFAGTPEPGIEPTLLSRDSSTPLMSIALADYLPRMAAFIDDSLQIISAEVHSYDEDTEIDQFIFGIGVGANGTVVATPATPAAQLTVTFKTALGNLYRWYLMEPCLPVGTNSTDFVANSDINALTDWMVSSECFIWGRDGREMFSPVRWRTKINDALRAAMNL